VLSDVSLELKVEADGASGSLALITSPEAKTDTRGTAQWVLSYSGLTWDNVSGANYALKCAVHGKEGMSADATSMRICVGQNVATLLQAGNAEAATAFKLPNPWYLSNGGWRDAIADWAFPDFLRGPLWNVSELVAGFPEMVGLGHLYHCGDFQSSVYNWMRAKRFGTDDPERIARMNGVEIAQYTMGYTHFFSGIYLSGSQPDDDPRFLDPWWLQQWGEALTWSDQKLRSAGAAASAMLLIIGVAKMIAVSAAAFGARVVSVAEITAGVRKFFFTGYGLRGMTARGLLVAAKDKFLCGAEPSKYLANGYYMDYPQPSARRDIDHASHYWLQVAADRLKAGGVGRVNPVEPW
jgi:hypothetical protein